MTIFLRIADMRTFFALLGMVILFILVIGASSGIAPGSLPLRIALTIAAAIIAWKISTVSNRPIAVVGLVLSSIAAIVFGVGAVQDRSGGNPGAGLSNAENETIAAQRRLVAAHEKEAPEKKSVEEMAKLRTSNPDEYLRTLKSTDLSAWKEEAAKLRPKEYAAYVEEQKRKAEAAELERQRKNPVAYLTLDYTWEKGGFDRVMIGTFKIKSDLLFDVRDIEIVCVTVGNSGTRLSKASQTIYDVVPAKKTKTFPKINMGFINSQSTRSSCEIASVRS